jgi:hypothetical protein
MPRNAKVKAESWFFPQADRGHRPAETPQAFEKWK